MKNLEKLSALDFAKSSTLVWLVPHLSKVGISPKVIVSFRSFDGYALSRHDKLGWSFNHLVDAYVDVYMTAWLQLNRYGGVVIDLEDLCSEDESEWAKAVAELTTLKQEDLMANRDELLTTPKAKASNSFDSSQFPAEIRSTETIFAEHKNKIFAGK